MNRKKPLLCRIGLHDYALTDHDEVRWSKPIPGTDPPQALRYHVRPMLCLGCGKGKDYLRSEWPGSVTEAPTPRRHHER